MLTDPLPAASGAILGFEGCGLVWPEEMGLRVSDHMPMLSID